MNKIQLFSEKATYASPSSKLIILQGMQCLMNNSPEGGSSAGEVSPWDDDTDEDY